MNSPYPFGRIKNELHALWSLCWPTLIGLLANVGMGAADIAMAGHYSAQDLAGVSLGVSIWHVTTVTIIGLMMVVNSQVSQLVGAKKFDKIQSTVIQSLWMALFIGLAAWAIVQQARLIYGYMAISPEVKHIATEFVFIISFALPAFACYRSLYGYLASVGRTKIIMSVAILGLLESIFLNWVFVWGNLGFPAMGGIGCAWSNLITVWTNLALASAWIWWYDYKRHNIPYQVFEVPNYPKIFTMLKIGTPVAITQFAETSAFSLIALAIAKFGAENVAAHQIALNFTSIVFMLPMGFGISLLTRVGQAIGAKDMHEARFRANVGVLTALAFGLVSAFCIAYFNTFIASLYTNDAKVQDMAAALFIFAALFQISDATQVVISNAIRAYQTTRVPMIIHLSAFLLICIPLGLWLGLAPSFLPLPPWDTTGPTGFWLALIIGLSIAALGLFIYLKHISQQFIDQGMRQILR